ncbi:DUF2931 family protein [Marinobacter sp. AL4B]|uniref:DUF2931 family protein n=1 Tax=Marinobacter sp. AL4B TaxID=2871173 RepID=UPI001CAA7FD9|nr:DUF2931 family protein [Marinobacter sp. AL4B]MBZ0332606.1 DUF2931 family protein [Marinobacter sp. AL4B]
MRILVAIVTFMTATLLTGCVSWSGEKKHWDLTVAAPERYHMWLIDAHLEKSGVRSWRGPVGGGVECCWKGDDGPFGSGGSMEPFPNLIALHWFSFAEQKYYSAFIRVPPDLEERMAEPALTYTQKGDERYLPRYNLVLGLAPGGEVVVWIMSQFSNAVEVLRVPAKEVPGDPADFAGLTKAYLEEHGAYLKEHGVPLEGW